MYWTFKRVLLYVGITLFIGFIFFYAYYQSRGIIAGPQISITTPQNGEVFASPLIHINGKVVRAKEITLDGRAIFIDLGKNFNEELLLAPGYNIIELAAKDADGHDTKQTLEVIYSGKAEPPGVSSSTLVRSSSTTSTTTPSKVLHN